MVNLCAPNLGSVGHEDGGGEVPRHAGNHVNDGHAGCPGHLLQIAQEEELDHHRQNQVQDSGETQQR